LNELALFAGAGGGILGSHLLGNRTVCAVEIDPYCREVLLRRQEEKHIPPFPIWDDARTFDGEPWRSIVDLVTAGFPCQPFSEAGLRLAEKDPRNMWPETIRIVREVGPQHVLLENVPGLLRTGYFGAILRDLSDAGFDAEWRIVSAGECDAPHLRKRLWIHAYANSKRQPRWTERDSAACEPVETQQRHNAGGLCDNVSNSDGKRRHASRDNNGLNDGDKFSSVCEYVSNSVEQFTHGGD
jgi:DNA (cytosine-5)-methyltransferase 1